MKKPILPIVTIICIILLGSCNEQSKTEVEIGKAINKQLTIELFDSVTYKDKRISFADFRMQFRFISIVFLQEGCAPCYPKFVEWHKKMESIDVPDNYTTLFVINAKSYKHFLAGSGGSELIDNKYYHVIDPEGMFLIRNSNIPRWIIDRTLLIDSTTRIKLIGVPFATEDMKKLFHSITDVTQ